MSISARTSLDADTLARSRRTLGEDHPDTLRSPRNSLGLDLSNLGEHQRAHDLDADTLARSRRTLAGEDQPDTLPAPQATSRL